MDFIGVRAGAVIINNDGKFFLAKKGPGARDDIGKWEFPGGAIRFFETREDGAKRNILEKYGVEVSIESTLCIYDVIDRKNKDHWISTTFLCNYRKEIPVINDKRKCEEIGWFSLEEIFELDISRILY